MEHTAKTGLRLSVLDQSPIPEGFTAGDALHNSLQLARRADELGYHRYWVAEHHGTPALACASPEVLIGPIAAATEHLRLGSGGVMLPHYSPLKVAENFSMLSSLYPGRIDLGIGRAAGTTPKVSVALQRDRRMQPPDDFPEQFNELRTYLNNHVPPNGPFSRLVAPAIRFESPELWLLGSSPQSGIWAAEWSLPYVFADFINPHGEAIAQDYLNQFIPSEHMPKPQLALALWAVCAETTEEAFELSLSVRMMMTMLYRGRSIAVPTVSRAKQFLAEEDAPPETLPIGRRILFGSPEKIRDEVETLAAQYGAGEVLIVNIVHDHAARLRSYELIAEEFELSRSSPQNSGERALATVR